MPKETENHEISVTDLIDYLFPFGKLLEWSDEVYKEGKKPPQNLMGKISQITKRDDFWRLDPVVTDPNIILLRPSTNEAVHPIFADYFYPKSLEVLEDEELRRAMDRVAGNIREAIPKGQFYLTMRFATVLVGAITEPHQLTYKEIIDIAKHHCLQRVTFDYKGMSSIPMSGSPEENAFLLYGCMKIIAQRLDRGILGKASWVDEYKS